MSPHTSWKSAGRVHFLLWCLVQVTRCTAWSLEHTLGWGCHTPVICLPRAHACAHPAWDYKLQALPQCWQPGIYSVFPLMIPHDNACEVGQKVIFQKLLKKSKETVLLSLDTRNCGYYWSAISDYYLFCMDHQNVLKYFAFPEIICCQSFSFEECFSYVIKPHPISHLLKLSKQQRERTRKEIKWKRERKGIDGGRK